jgi:transposase
MTDTHPEVSTPALDLRVYLGVDTHKDTHHGALVDHLGRAVADREFPTTTTGYRNMIVWAQGSGIVAAAGVEGTGTYGAGLTAALRGAGIDVVEVDSPDLRARRHRGKTDQVDAYAAARAAASGRATTVPKTREGDCEAIRLLHIVRRTAVKARAEAITQLKALIVTVPDTLRRTLRELSANALVRACAGLRPDPRHLADGDIVAAAKTALRSLAHRILDLSSEITALEQARNPLTERQAPHLLALVGVGYESASQLLITVGDNRERITNEAHFANLCGVAPISASSGKTIRHRLNRGGNRQANRALHTIAVTRLHHDPETQAYLAKRLADGKTRRETIRCLKRYLARRIYNLLNPTTHT